jgi:hypothetical protein
MKVLSALAEMIRSVMNFFANGLNSGSHKLNKYNDENVDIPAILDQVRRKSKKELDAQCTMLAESKAETEIVKGELTSKRTYLTNAIQSIDNIETQLKDETLSEAKRNELTDDLEMIRLGAESAISMITLYEQSIEEREVAIESMKTAIAKNKKDVYKLTSELEQLVVKQRLNKTQQNISNITLTGDFDLAKLKQVVNSEAALFKATAEVERQFKTEPETLVSEYGTETENKHKVDEMLKQYRAEKAA